MRAWLLLAVAVATGPNLARAQFKLPKKLDELETIARKDSNDAAAHFNVALAYWNAKRGDDVERELRLAEKIEAQFAEGRLALSRVAFGQPGKLGDDNAAPRASRAIQPKPDETGAHYQRA